MKQVIVPVLNFQGEEYRNVTFLRASYALSPDTWALQAVTEEGEPLATFSVNLVGQPPAPGCIWVKTWSEGDGYLTFLEELGLVESTPRTVTVNQWGSVAIEARVLGELA